MDGLVLVLHTPQDSFLSSEQKVNLSMSSCWACLWALLISACWAGMSPRLLVLLALSSCLGALLYLYWRESCELRNSLLANRQLQKELTSSRSERDQVQFRLNLLREDVESAQRAHEESERRAQGLDEQLQEEQGKLVSREPWMYVEPGASDMHAHGD